MDAPVLVDSCVFIGLLRAGLDPVASLAEWGELTDFATCGVVQLEVLRGIRSPKALRRLEEFFSVLQWVDLDIARWQDARKLAWELDRKGQVLPATDLAIAACALHIGAAVLTQDAHFSLVPGLRTLDIDLR